MTDKDDEYDINAAGGTVNVDGKEIPISDMSFSLESNVDDREFEGVHIGQMECEGSFSFTLEPGDEAPYPCPDCGHFPTKAGKTIDELATLECPECDWFEVFDEPLDELYSDE